MMSAINPDIRRRSSRRTHRVPQRLVSASTRPTRPQRPDGRSAVNARADLRGRARHPSPAYRVLHRDRDRARCRRQHGLFRRALRHRRNDRPREPGSCAARSLAAERFLGGVFHTLPFLIPSYQPRSPPQSRSLRSRLLLLGWLRHKFFNTSFHPLVRVCHCRWCDHREPECSTGSDRRGLSLDSAGALEPAIRWLPIPHRRCTALRPGARQQYGRRCGN